MDHTFLEIANLVARIKSGLENGIGLSLEQTADFPRVSEIAADLDKQFFNDYVDPANNDLFQSGCFWFVISADDKPVGLLGARYEDTVKTSLNQHYEQRIKRLFGSQVADVDLSRTQPPMANLIQGKICYLGDLYIDEDFRVPKSNYLKLIVMAAFFLIRMQWQDVAWVYAFIRQRHFELGLGSRFGFTHQYEGASSWGAPRLGDFGNYALCALPRADLDDKIAACIARPEMLDLSLPKAAPVAGRPILASG